MSFLTPDDLRFVVSRIPRDIRELLKKKPELILAGGFIRAVIAGEPVSDIDLWGPSKEFLESIAKDLALSRKGRYFSTDNAFTVLAPGRAPIQLIHRWLFTDAESCIKSFDFTIAQAGVVWKKRETGWSASAGWEAPCGDRFYSDLAAKRLYYTAPIRNEDAGGSLLRARKFLARGYTIQAPSLAAVLARLFMGVRSSSLADSSEAGLAAVILGLLREVDPLTVLDGFDLVENDEGDGEPKSVESGDQGTGP